MKNTLHQKFHLNNPGTGEKEFIKIPDYVKSFIYDHRETSVFGERQPIISFTLLYDHANPKYKTNQYLAIRSFKEKKDNLLDNGYAFAGLLQYGDNRTDRIYVYAKLVQLN